MLDKINEIKIIIGVVFSAIAGFFSNLYGGWNAGLTVLVALMAIDFITGLMLAFSGKSNKSATGAVSSKAGINGLFKKFAILLIVLACHGADILFNIDYLKTAAIVGFGFFELVSIFENGGGLGIKYPKKLVDALDVLRTKADGEPEPVDTYEGEEEPATPLTDGYEAKDTEKGSGGDE